MGDFFATAESKRSETARQRVQLVKDSAAQTTPPNSPYSRRRDLHAPRSSEVKVTAGNVNGPSTPEFRTIVNVFEDRLRPDSSEVGATVYTDRPAVVMDTDSLQSTAAVAATDHHGSRVYTDKLRRTNGLAPDKLPNSKGSLNAILTEAGF